MFDLLLLFTLNKPMDPDTYACTLKARLQQQVVELKQEVAELETQVEERVEKPVDAVEPQD